MSPSVLPFGHTRASRQKGLLRYVWTVNHNTYCRVFSREVYFHCCCVANPKALVNALPFQYRWSVFSYPCSAKSIREAITVYRKIARNLSRTPVVAFLRRLPRRACACSSLQRDGRWYISGTRYRGARVSCDTIRGKAKIVPQVKKAKMTSFTTRNRMPHYNSSSSKYCSLSPKARLTPFGICV